MKKQLIILSVVFMFVTLTGLSVGVNAQSSPDLLFASNQEFDLKIPCVNNGSYCGSTAQCNVTVIYPNGEILLDNSPMTNKDSFHNITISQSQNNQLGVHTASATCCDSGFCGEDTFTIEITGDGFKFNAFPIQFSVFIVGLIMIVVGKFREDLSFFASLGGMMLMGIGVVTLYPGYAGLNSHNLTGQIIGFSAIGGGFYFMIERFFSRDEQQERFGQPQRSEQNLNDGRVHDL